MRHQGPLLSILFLSALVGCRREDAKVVVPVSPLSNRDTAIVGPSAQKPVGRPETRVPPDAAPGPLAEKSVGDDTLEQEEKEANPKSETVKLKLVISPSVEGTIHWGAKLLGRIAPRALEFERPRASGPIDLVIRAPGYFPHYTRMFTDRDDKLTVRLVKIGEESGLLGSKRTATPLSQ